MTMLASGSRNAARAYSHDEVSTTFCDQIKLSLGSSKADIYADNRRRRAAFASRSLEPEEACPTEPREAWPLTDPIIKLQPL